MRLPGGWVTFPFLESHQEVTWSGARGCEETVVSLLEVRGTEVMWNRPEGLQRVGPIS